MMMESPANDTLLRPVCITSLTVSRAGEQLFERRQGGHITTVCGYQRTFTSPISTRLIGGWAESPRSKLRLETCAENEKNPYRNDPLLVMPFPIFETKGGLLFAACLRPTSPNLINSNCVVVYPQGRADRSHLNKFYFFARLLLFIFST